MSEEPEETPTTPAEEEPEVIDDGQEEEDPAVTDRANWCKVLVSPKSSGIFSPSQETTLHGYGLLRATNREKQLTRSGQQCATLLFEVASLYETMAVSIHKASISLPVAGHPVAQDALAVNKSLQSFAREIQGFAITVRGSVARPLHASLQSMGETAPSIYSRYSVSRQRCLAARQSALRVRLRYVKAIREAESGIQEFIDAKSQASTLTDTNVRSNEQLERTNMDGSNTKPAWENIVRRWGRQYGIPASADRLVGAMKEVQVSEDQYRKLVDEENAAISQAETMEAMGLESIQKMEEQRLEVFAESIYRAVQAESGALERMILSIEHSGEMKQDPAASPSASPGKRKEPQEFFRNLLKQNTSGVDEEDVGIMEAETLGLPQEIGILRDKVKGALRARESRIGAVKAAAAALEEVASATASLSSILNSRLGQDGFGSKQPSTVAGAEVLSSVLSEIEGARISEYCMKLITSIEDFGDEAKELARTIRNSRHQHFDTFVLRADKEFKNLSDVSDTRWKQVCEAARSESRAQTRYQQATQNFEKARNRIKSFDQGGGSGGGSSGGDDAMENTSASVRGRRESAQRINAGMSKALGNMISILPNGGEHAMKIMGEDTKRAITQAKLSEAEQRESKDKSTLDSAVQTKEAVIQNYRQSAHIMIESMHRDDNEGWDEMIKALESVVTALNVFHERRRSSISRLQSQYDSLKSELLNDATDWIEKVQTDLSKKEAKDVETDQVGETPDYYLQVERIDSKRVYNLLNRSTSDDDFDLDEASTENLLDDESRKDETENSRRSNTVEESAKGVVKPWSIGDILKGGGDASQEATSTKSESKKAETDVFLLHFWSDRSPDETPPTVISSFSCAYWPKDTEGFMSPLLHGRIFLTKDKFYFVGWSEKKIVLNWKHVASVSKEKNLMGTIDNSLKLIDDKDQGYFFGSFTNREEAFLMMERLSTVARSISEISDGRDSSANSETSLAPVPPDVVMKKMDKIMSKKIKNISIQKFYEVAWSEGCKSDADPLYGPWLVQMGSNKVKVGDWEFGEFANEWCGATYSQKRTVHFEFKRTTHLYIGPPIAKVQQKQFCEVDGKDKCILHMALDFDGIPYSDCFGVEVRWVARRMDANDVLIEIGCFVRFKKKTILAAKIRSGTLSETKPIHESLFQHVREACAKAVGMSNEQVEDTADEEEEKEVSTVEKPARSLGVPAGAVLTLAKSFAKNIGEGDPTALAIAFFGVTGLVIGGRLLFTTRGSVETRMIENLSQEVADLKLEVFHLRSAMAELVALMKEVKDSKSLSR